MRGVTYRYIYGSGRLKNPLAPSCYIATIYQAMVNGGRGADLKLIVSSQLFSYHLFSIDAWYLKCRKKKTSDVAGINAADGYFQRALQINECQFVMLATRELRYAVQCDSISIFHWKLP